MLQTLFPRRGYNFRSDVDTPIPIPPGEDLPSPVKEPPDKPVLEPAIRSANRSLPSPRAYEPVRLPCQARSLRPRESPTMPDWSPCPDQARASRCAAPWSAGSHGPCCGPAWGWSRSCHCCWPHSPASSGCRFRSGTCHAAAWNRIWPLRPFALRRRPVVGRVSALVPHRALVGARGAAACSHRRRRRSRRAVAGLLIVNGCAG